MSVWHTPVYRDDPLQTCYKFLSPETYTTAFVRSLCDFHIEDPGVHELPVGVKAGKFIEQTFANPAVIDALCNARKIKFANAVTERIKRLDPCVIGLAAVYQVFHRLWYNLPVVEEAEETLLTDAIARVGLAVSYHTVKDLEERLPVHIMLLKELVLPAEKMFYALLRLALFHQRHEYRFNLEVDDMSGKAMDPIVNDDTAILGASAVFNIYGALILQFGPKSYLLTKNDIQRLERLLRGLCYADYYITTEGITDDREDILQAYEDYKATMLEAMKHISAADAQVLCRAYDLAYHLKLAHLSVDVSNRSLEDQRKKCKKENLDHLIDMTKLMGILEPIAPREALEIALLYKVLPAPDFDIYGAMHRQKQLWDKQNEIFDEEFFQEILIQYRFLMIQAFHAKHHRCPGTFNPPVLFGGHVPAVMQNYPDIDPMKIPTDLVQYIDFYGEFVYKDHILDSFDLIKDKAICSKEISKANTVDEYRELGTYGRNQLLDYIHRDEAVCMQDQRANIGNLFCDVKAEDKAEAKKPNGRMFFEAHTDIRMVMSEYELSIADYGSHLDGFMQGKGIVEKQQMMNKVSEFVPALFNKQYLFVSFDIDKFSPRLPFRVHTELDRIWSQAFAIPDLDRVSRIFIDGEVHYIKRKIHHKMKKHGNDYEGFFGKKLTFYHMAVMRASMNRLIGIKMIDPEYQYACQIDDGLLRIRVDKDDFAKNVKVFYQHLYNLWLAAGMEISWDKTYISGRLAMFLNEIRLCGRAINPPLRAVLKMTQRDEAVVRSLPEDLATAESTTRGAIVAGAVPFATYVLYSHLVTTSVNHWRDRKTKVHVGQVAHMFAPVSLGGLSLKNQISLMGSLDGPDLSAALGNLSGIPRRFPDTHETVERVLNQTARHITPMGSLIAPTSITAAPHVLHPGRLRLTLQKHLLSHLNTPVLRIFGFAHSIERTKAVAELVARCLDLPCEMREIWYESTPLAMVDSIITKITSARTAATLVPRRVLRKVTYANAAEARTVLMSL